VVAEIMDGCKGVGERRWVQGGRRNNGWVQGGSRNNGWVQGGRRAEMGAKKVIEDTMGAMWSRIGR